MNYELLWFNFVANAQWSKGFPLNFNNWILMFLLLISLYNFFLKILCFCVYFFNNWNLNCKITLQISLLSHNFILLVCTVHLKETIPQTLVAAVHFYSTMVTSASCKLNHGWTASDWQPIVTEVQLGNNVTLLNYHHNIVIIQDLIQSITW